MRAAEVGRDPTAGGGAWFTPPARLVHDARLGQEQNAPCWARLGLMIRTPRQRDE